MTGFGLNMTEFLKNINRFVSLTGFVLLINGCVLNIENVAMKEFGPD